MDPIEQIPNITPEQLPKVEDVFVEYNKRNVELTTEEEDFVISLIAILETTELPQFDMVHITSTKNDYVKDKAKAVFSQIPQEEAIPENMRLQYPISYEEETILKAPWVNLVHGWAKVLNYMNGIRSMQMRQQLPDPEDIANISHSLYLLTTNSDPNPFVRTDEGFLKGEFSETRLRKAGVKGVNPSRHVCYEEMKYMLNVVKSRFVKKVEE